MTAVAQTPSSFEHLLKPVAQYDVSGRKVAEFPSRFAAATATATGGPSVSEAIRFPHRRAGGFYWRNSDGDAPDQIDVPRRFVRPNARRVVQYDTEGNKLGEYQSVGLAAKATGLHAANICNAAAGRRGKVRVGGYVWLYADSEVHLFREVRAGNVAARNTLIERYMPLVTNGAERIHVRLPKLVRLEDLVSAGVFGLIDSINRFEPARGNKLATFAQPRIRGAIIDWIRAQDDVSRLMRNRAAQVDRAAERFRQDFGYQPGEEELAQAMRLPRREFAKVYADAVPPETKSLSGCVFTTDNDRSIKTGDLLTDESTPDPVLSLERHDLREFVVRGLNRTERLVVVLYFYEDLTMKEISRVIDISESRISQMLADVIERLKAREDGLEELLSGRAA